MRFSFSVVILTLVLATAISCDKEATSTDTATTSTTTASDRATTVPGPARAAEFDPAKQTRVRVIITGLITIADAQGKPAEGELLGKRLVVLNARTTRGHAHDVVHLPVVMADKPFAPTTSRPTSKAKDFTVIELNGEPLAFSNVNLAMSKLAYTETPPASVCATEAEESSLYFIPRMKRIVPAGDNGGKELDATFLDKNHIDPQPGSSVIAAWLDVPYGSLKADLKNPIVWDFQDESSKRKSDLRQMLAQEVHWEFVIDGKTLTLDNVADPQKPQPVMELTASGAEIELYIVNAPQSGINSIVTGIGGMHEPDDPHFHRYYEYFKPYLEDTKKARYTPIVAGVCLPIANTFSTDPCDIFKQVRIPRPEGCTGSPAVGDSNCGPNGT